jgi:CRP-like cAMP-binding protein
MGGEKREGTVKNGTIDQEGTGRYNLPGEGSYGELVRDKLSTSPVKQYEAGTYLFRAGQSAECFYLVKSGRIAQYKGETRISELGPKRFLGMRTFLLRGRFETTAQTTEPSEIVELGLVFLRDFLKRPEAVLAFLREQEQELFRLAEAGAKREMMFTAVRQQMSVLEAQLRRGGNSETTSHERAAKVLQLVRQDVLQASATLDSLARNEPAVWKTLEASEAFTQLFLAVKGAAGHLESADFSSRSDRRS